MNIFNKIRLDNKWFDQTTIFLFNICVEDDRIEEEEKKWGARERKKKTAHRPFLIRLILREARTPYVAN